MGEKILEEVSVLAVHLRHRKNQYLCHFSISIKTKTFYIGKGIRSWLLLGQLILACTSFSYQ